MKTIKNGDSIKKPQNFRKKPRVPGNFANVAFFGIVKTWPEISGLLLTFNFFGDQAGSRIETPANISPLKGVITPNKNPLVLGVYGVD